ncbi:PCI-domain-containing protein [Serendipita vermifera]|nr:PCI-domain-containing protein [Serendipita vermifera]
MDDDDADYMQDVTSYYDDFEYSDGGGSAGTDESGVDLENSYYMAKGKKEDNPEGALKDFRAIVEAETEKGDWGFKALKQQTKLLFLVLNRPSEALETYKQLLTYTKSAVTRNYSEKSINSVLDYVGGAKSGADADVLERFYEATRNALKEAKNDRLSVKTNLKLAKLWLDRGEYDRLKRLLAELQASTQQGGDEDQAAKGTLLQEIYALEIQMYNETKNYKKLKEIYYASGQVTSAISHPRVVGVIKECGGKMWMREKQWEKASEDFFSSFHNYDEAGSPQRIQVLKYLVLAYLLMGSEIDPFDSQETKPYKNNPDIKAVTDLVGAYQRREVHEAEKILRENQSTFMDDPFIKSYIGDLLRALRTQYLIALIKPYTRLDLSFLARQLNIEKPEVEEILIGLILEGKVEGRIDQVAQRLELDRHQILEKRRYQALDQWAGTLENIHAAVVSKTAGRGGGGGPEGFDFEPQRWRME